MKFSNQNTLYGNEYKNYFDKYDVKFYHLYVLELQDGKYYVGISKDIQSRYEEHCRGAGADYTCAHKPIRIIHLENTQLAVKTEAEDVENMQTIKWMILKGIENVRGGDYCAISTASIMDRLGTESVERIKLAQQAVELLGTSKVDIDKIAQHVYENTFQYVEKQDEIEHVIANRRNRNGKAFCCVEMCVYNEHKTCRWGITPYDKHLCEEHFVAKV